MAPPISLPPSLSWGAMVRCMGQTAPPAARIPQRTQDGELGHRVLSWLVGGAFPTAAPKRVCGCTAFFRNNLDACGQTLASPCSLAGCSRSGQRAEPCCQTTPASSPPPRLSPSRSRRLALLQRSDQLCELTRVGRASLPAPSPPPSSSPTGFRPLPASRCVHGTSTRRPLIATGPLAAPHARHAEVEGLLMRVHTCPLPRRAGRRGRDSSCRGARPAGRTGRQAAPAVEGLLVPPPGTPGKDPKAAG